MAKTFKQSIKQLMGKRTYLFLKKQKLKYGLKRKLPRLVEIEIASVCNYRCKACAFGNGMINRPRTLMSKEKFQEIFNKLRQDGVKKIDINCVGEPFLNPDIYHILDIMLANGYSVTLPTNGSLIDIAKMQKYDKRVNLSISLDSIYYQAYAAYRRCSREMFEKALSNIKKLSQTNITLQIGILINRYNENHLAEIIDFAKNLGIPYQLSRIHCSPFGVKQTQLPPGVALSDNYIAQRYIAKADYHELAPQRKEHQAYNMYRYNPGLDLFVNCQRQVKTCQYIDDPWITAQGDVLPCCLTAYHTTVKFGNIFKTRNFKEIWFSDAFVKFRREMLNAQKSSYGACRICTAKSLA